MFDVFFYTKCYFIILEEQSQETVVIVLLSQNTSCCFEESQTFTEHIWETLLQIILLIFSDKCVVAEMKGHSPLFVGIVWHSTVGDTAIYQWLWYLLVTIAGPTETHPTRPP
jgi:hypothetical protein